jgi:hypothetical protein
LDLDLDWDLDLDLDGICRPTDRLRIDHSTERTH